MIAKTRIITIRILLHILNSAVLNRTPCKYGFIGNVDAFSEENLQSEERQCPGITVKTILEAAAHFKVCPLEGNFVIEPDGYRRMEQNDVLELRASIEGEVFSRPECIFNYCPNPEACKSECEAK